MSAFERAWLFLKQGDDELPDIFDVEEKPPPMPDIFDASGNIASDGPKTSSKKPVKEHADWEKYRQTSQEPQPLSAPANEAAGPPIAPIGEGHQLAVLGHRDWGLMHDDGYPKEALYHDMEVFDDKMQEWIEEHGMPSHIISGGYGGTDDLAQQWAEDNDIPLTVHSPRFREDGRWNALGARNDRITDSATHHLLFTSPMGIATQDAWRKANAKGKPVHVHSISSPGDTPLRNGAPPEKKDQPHWFREFMGDKSAKILPEDSKKRIAVGDKDRLTAAMRRTHGKQYAGGRMRVQSKNERENRTSSGTTEGFPMRAPFTSRSSKHIPKDTRTDEEKMHDRLLEMANETGANIQIEPRVGGGRSKEHQLEEIREKRRQRNEDATQERAMGNLPIPRSAASTMSDHHEAQMREDMAAMSEGRKPKKLTRRVPMHRGQRGGRSQPSEEEEELPDLFGGDDGDETINDPKNNVLAGQELERRIAYNRGEEVRARQNARAQAPLPTVDDEGMLIDLQDPHFIDDLRFQKMLRGMSPIDAAFSIIKGYSFATR